MGEKPMGVPATEEDPTAAGSGINTTRANIKSSGGTAAGVVDDDDDDQPAGASISTTRSNIRSGGGAVAPGDPVPDIDVKMGK